MARGRHTRSYRIDVALPAKRPYKPAVVDQVLEPPESTVLDLLDNLLTKGVMVNGDVTLGVAGIDLIYLRLAALLCAADRVMPHAPDNAAPPAPAATRRTRRRRRTAKPRA